jgi:hypothetical protein
MLLNRPAMVLQHASEGIGQVLDEMPAVSNLQGLGRTVGNPLRIRFRTVPRDNFDSCMVAEPVGERFWRPVRQQIDNVAPFMVNENGAVALPFPHGPIIHP